MQSMGGRGSDPGWKGAQALRGERGIELRGWGGGLTLSSLRQVHLVDARFMATEALSPGLSRTLGLWRLVFSMITAGVP